MELASSADSSKMSFQKYLVRVPVSQAYHGRFRVALLSPELSTSTNNISIFL